MTTVTDAALARLSASTQNSSSMKLSLAGREVPWTRKTSRPRTFSSTRTNTLPSEKCSVSHAAERVVEVVGDGLPEPPAGRAGEDHDVVVHGRHRSRQVATATSTIARRVTRMRLRTMHGRRGQHDAVGHQRGVADGQAVGPPGGGVEQREPPGGRGEPGQVGLAQRPQHLRALGDEHAGGEHRHEQPRPRRPATCERPARRRPRRGRGGTRHAGAAARSRRRGPARRPRRPTRAAGPTMSP